MFPFVIIIYADHINVLACGLEYNRHSDRQDYGIGAGIGPGVKILLHFNDHNSSNGIFRDEPSTMVILITSLGCLDIATLAI